MKYVDITDALFGYLDQYRVLAGRLTRDQVESALINLDIDRVQKRGMFGEVIKAPDAGKSVTSTMIYKYTLSADAKTGFSKIELPKGARILSAGSQGLNFVLWAAVDPGRTIEERTFLVAWTGEGIASDKAISHLATFTDNNGLVWHVFEIL